MPLTSNAASSDLEKVLESLQFITSIRSTDDLLEVFGLDNLPVAQKYGIFFGILTFAATVSTVIGLLVMGGSFKRISEQAEDGSGTIPDSIEERVSRPLLLERLLESQERMLKNYPEEILTEEPTRLTKMLMNIAPDIAKAKKLTATLVDEDDGDGKKISEKERLKKKEELKKYLPDGYEDNYIKAYRKCQDKPGGTYASLIEEDDILFSFFMIHELTK